jgi:hypothetical protein
MWKLASKSLGYFEKSQLRQSLQTRMLSGWDKKVKFRFTYKHKLIYTRKRASETVVVQIGSG